MRYLKLFIFKKDYSPKVIEVYVFLPLSKFLLVN
jgi:hypothetical protein